VLRWRGGWRRGSREEQEEKSERRREEGEEGQERRIQGRRIDSKLIEVRCFQSKWLVECCDGGGEGGGGMEGVREGELTQCMSSLERARV